MVFVNLSWNGTIALDSIKTATTSAITVNLSKDGKFVIKNETGQEAITFDAFGNGTFAGTLTADKIRANQIEGLEIFTDKISSLLALQGDALQAQTASNAASVSVKDLEGLRAEVKNLSSRVDLL